MFLRSAVLLFSLCISSPGNADSSGAYLPLSGVIPAPSAAANLCVQYSWACMSTPVGDIDSAALLRAAREVNRLVNQRVQTVDDSVQYRVKDKWSLPTGRGGDCEDFALLKKYELIEKGVAADRLLIATVISPTRGPHAVLVLRLDDGDHVLDNLTSAIKPWHRTGYTFLAVQNPAAPETWRRISMSG